MKFPEDVPTLTDGVVTLRAHRESDVAALTEQATDPVTVEWTTVPVPSSDETSRDYATKIIPTGWRDDMEWNFAVEAADDAGAASFAGSVSLRNEGDRRAEIAYGAHPWARGRGIMFRALNLLLDWGFEHQKLESVIWWANEGNWASRKLAWRLGFSFDGTVRKRLDQRGQLYDAWVGALVHGDQRAPRTRWLDAPHIVGGKAVLRAHEARDASRVREACDDERTSYWLTEMPSPYTMDHAEQYTENRREAHARGTGTNWAVADPETDELIANISIMDITPGDDAEIGYWTHPAARGRGVMTEACGLAIRHAFIPEEDGGLGLRRLTILAVVGNAASRHVIVANGFVETGRHRKDARLRDGTWVDTIVYDLLLEDYR